MQEIDMRAAAITQEYVERVGEPSPVREWLEGWSNRTARPWRSNVTYPLPNELADNVEATPTDGRHIHVATPSGQRSTLVSRGWAYQVHFSQHYYRHPDGAWRREHPDPEQNRPGNGAGRLYGADDLPAGARAKLLDALDAAVAAWTAEHPDELRGADLAALNNAANRREEKLAKLAAETLAVVDELDAIDDERDDAPRY